MRKKSMLLMVCLALLVGLMGTAVVLAQGKGGQQEVEAQPTVEVPTGEVISELSAPDATSTVSHVEILSGSVSFSRDTTPVQVSGTIILRPAPAVGSDKISTQPTPIAVEETAVVSADRPAGIAPNTTCYICIGQ